MNKLPEGFSPVDRRYIDQSKPKRVVVKRAYRPVGFWVVLTILVFVVLTDHGFDLLSALLSTALIALLMIMFS